MKRGKTWVSKNQLKKYGFSIETAYKTDLSANRVLEGVGVMHLFNYDYYTVRPDNILMIDLNGGRVFEGNCQSRVRFQKIMKRLKIKPHR